MKHEFDKSSGAVRLVFAVAAVVITTSIGGFIDHLATDLAGTELAASPSLSRSGVASSASQPGSRS